MAKKIEVELPVIPREVADEYGKLVELYTEDAIIGALARDGYIVGYPAISKLSAKEVVRMMDHGYTVEQSPEEKVREFYERYSHGGLDGHYRAAITETLDLLGIKIEGVNADATE